MTRDWRSILIISVLVAAAIVVVSRSAWVGDDAFITLRTIDNFVHGYGLTWNVAERVQGYTHPAWMLLLSVFYFVTREPYFTTIAVSLLLSAGTLIFVGFRLSVTAATAVFSLAILTLSKPFVDFSTSGLENPLTHFLLVFFGWLYVRRKFDNHSLFLLSLVASAVMLNRMDTGLLVFPALAYAFLRNRSRGGFVAITVGTLPFVLWLGFATIYYGFPVPNTAYAKLSTGILRADLVDQGWHYLQNSMHLSPITMASIVAGILSVFRRRGTFLMPLALGILLYIWYVVQVGGDFMSGRFLSGPLVVAVVMLSQVSIDYRRARQLAVPVFILALGFFWPRCPLWSGADYGSGVEGPEWDRGITDERAAYYPDNGLLQASRFGSMPDNDWFMDGDSVKANGDTVVVRAGTGFFGYAAGPGVYVVDRHGLTDPLLARLPTINRHRWRIGHFNRLVPDGYLRTLETGINSIRDQRLALYYDRLRLVVSGELFDGERLKEIVRFLLGRNDHLLEVYAGVPARRIKQTAVASVKPPGSPWNCEGAVIFNGRGIGIEFDTSLHADTLEIGVDHNDHYTVHYICDGTALAKAEIVPDLIPGGGLRVNTLSVPSEVAEAGIDWLVIKPWGGDGRYSLGHVRNPADWNAARPNWPTISTVPIAELSHPQSQGTNWKCRDCLQLDPGGLSIELGSVRKASRMEISVDHNDDYLFMCYRDTSLVGLIPVPKHWISERGLRVDTLDIPAEAVQNGYNNIVIIPAGGDGLYSVGHVRFLEETDN